MKLNDSEINRLLELRIEMAEDVAERMQKSLRKTEDSLEKAEAKISELKALLAFMFIMLMIACFGVILMIYIK